MNLNRDRIISKPLFEFIQYIQPTWYFNLVNSHHPPWIDYFKLNTEDRAIIKWDPKYASKEGSFFDAAYQALQKGILPNASNASNLTDAPDPSLDDNYRFVKKYFHPFWMIYILLMRLMTLKNPVREISAFIKAWSAKRNNLFLSPKTYTDYPFFISYVEQAQPLISIVIPTLNRYKYLEGVLTDLENQSYKNFEVLIADQSEPYNEVFYRGWKIDLIVFRQKEKALWLARNQCIKKASGDYILLFDDDSRVKPDWIRQHLKCLDYFQADISSGVSWSMVGSNVPGNYRFFRLSDQVDTGNAMIKKEVFNKTGLFDQQFEKQRMGDAEFGLRAYLKGFKNISNPYAGRLHLKVGTGGLRQMGSWDAYRPKSLRRPRPVPSVLYYIHKYHGKRAATYSLLQNLPPSLLPYRFKKYRATYFAGLLLTILLLPLVLYQVRQAWREASKMLRQGEKIPFLNHHDENIGHIV